LSFRIVYCDAGGYWSVEHESAAGPGGSSPVTLCVSHYRLSLLAVSPDDDDLFIVKADYRTSNIVCWKLHFANHQKCRIAYLSVTVAPDGNPANCNCNLFIYIFIMKIAHEVKSRPKYGSKIQ